MTTLNEILFLTGKALFYFTVVFPIILVIGAIIKTLLDLGDTYESDYWN